MQFLAEHICFSWDGVNSSFMPSCRWYKTKGQNKKGEKTSFFKEEFTWRSKRKTKNITFWGASSVERQWSCHVGRLCADCKSPPHPLWRRKETGLRHHPEDESGITGREWKKKHMRRGLISPPPPPSSFICVKASWITAVVTRWCCKGRFDPCAAGPGEEDEGMRKRRSTSRRDNHHNSCAAEWLMAAINVARERRGCYMCCGGEWCFALHKLKVQGNNSPYSFNGEKKKNLHLRLETPAAFVSWSPKMIAPRVGWMDFLPGSYPRWKMFTNTYVIFSILTIY